MVPLSPITGSPFRLTKTNMFWMYFVRHPQAHPIGPISLVLCRLSNHKHSSKNFLRHLLRLEERPIMRYVGFTTEITVKTAGASHSFVEFVERNFDMLLAGLRRFDSAYPANPIPTGKWGNILP